jgi:hypothetical protein
MNDTVTYLLMTREGFGNVYYCLQRKAVYSNPLMSPETTFQY